MVGKRGHFRGVSFPEREDRGLARTRGRRRAFGDHLRENRALYLARAIGNRPRLALYDPERSEEHTSELQTLMRISYAVFCLKKKKKNKHNNQYQQNRDKPIRQQNR